MKETIKPKVVPFEIAKLLKECGYDEKIAEFWAYSEPWTAKGGIRKGGKYSNHYGSYVAYSNSEWESTNVSFAKAFKLSDKHPAISAPSYDMVLDWILEHLGYYVCVGNFTKGKFSWQATSWVVEEGLCHSDGKEYNSRYEAMDVAFKSLLEARKENNEDEKTKRLLEMIKKEKKNGKAEND